MTSTADLIQKLNSYLYKIEHQNYANSSKNKLNACPKLLLLFPKSTGVFRFLHNLESFNNTVYMI